MVGPDNCPRDREGSRSARLGCLFLILLAASWPAPAQRLKTSFSAGKSEELIFDVNEVPLRRGPQTDLNFSPNVVFSADSSRGFVSYPGASQVAVFDTGTGELIQLVEVRSNPALLTVSPDGRTVAAVCLRLDVNLPDPVSGFQSSEEGAIALIDADTLEVRFIDLTDVFFSFANNLVFSADSAGAFVASAGTDQLIRLDVNGASEVDRIAFSDGTRPTSITMAQDFSRMGVVLVGSGALGTFEVRDSVQLVDPSAFSVIREIMPAREEEAVLNHDFRVGNTLAISPDGRFGFIADNETSSIGAIPELTPDHGHFLDLTTGETVETYSVGGVTHGSYPTPEGRFFVQISALTITVIEIESGASFFAQPFPSEFRPARPAFDGNGLMYLTSPFHDLLMTFKPATLSVVATLQVGGDVNRIVDEAVVAVPSGPMDVAISPDQRTITTVNFNANSVDIFRPTSAFTVPQLIAENLEEDAAGEPIPAGERFFTGVALSNFGSQNAEVILTPVAALDVPFEAELISANPNPIPICDAQLGRTTIDWNAGAAAEEIEIRVGAPDGNLFFSGAASGSQETGDWVTDGMVFYLLDASSGEVLDTVTVTFTDGCNRIRAVPNPIPVCPGERGQTFVSWDATELEVETIEIRIGSPDGTLWVSGSPSGAQQTGQWVTDGMVFYLLDQSSAEVLDTLTVTFTEVTGGLSACPVTELLVPDQQINFTTNSLLQPEEPGDIDGWLGVDSDEPTVAGMFLTFDGEVNRLDGGPIASRGTQVAVLPETVHGDGFNTQIEIVNPNFTPITVFFDLFNSDGEFVGTSLQSLPSRNRRSFPFLGDPGDFSSRGLFDALTSGDDGVQLIIANPNPVMACDGALGMTTIAWDVTGLAEEIEIRVGAPDGNLFFSGGPAGSQETGQWVTDGMVFYLLDAATAEVLDTVTVRLTENGCSPLSANPNPIPVCEGTVGVTNLSWDTEGEAAEIEIRVGAPDGTLMVAAGGSGFFRTGKFVKDGTEFFLLNRETGDVIDSVVVTHTKQGCSIPGYTDGYIRAFSGNEFVAFEVISDASRMAALAAHESEAETTRFTVPHYAVFGGSDTIVKLIHPSSLPFGGVSGDEEPETGEPIRVSLALRSDDGSPVGEPVAVELVDGASLRSSVIDLFGLQDVGVLQSGWIEVLSDRPGLAGSAVIEIFEGRAMSAFPLQPVSHSSFVFPHVAQGLGFSTGLAVVNSGQLPAQVRIELRESDARLIGTAGPFSLQAGHRIVGIVPELFPGAGEVLGGTLKVISDQPLTGVELFYTDDLKVLSTVPSQGIQ